MEALLLSLQLLAQGLSVLYALFRLLSLFRRSAMNPIEEVLSPDELWDLDDVATTPSALALYRTELAQKAIEVEMALREAWRLQRERARKVDHDQP